MLERNEGIWRRLCVFVLDFKRHCWSLLSYAMSFLGLKLYVLPLCPSLTPLLARCPLLPLAMAYDLFFWCPFFNLYAICQFIPEVKLFISRCHNFWSHVEDRPDMLTVIPHRRTQTQSLYPHLWVCKFVNVCLTERQRGRKRRNKTMFWCYTFCLQGPYSALLWRHLEWLKLEAICSDVWERSNAAIHVELIKFHSSIDKLTPTTLNIGLKMLSLLNGVQTTYSLFKKSWKMKVYDEGIVYHGTQQH